jgi:hypothetical protein
VSAVHVGRLMQLKCQLQARPCCQPGRKYWQVHKPLLAHCDGQTCKASTTHTTHQHLLPWMNFQTVPNPAVHCCI